MIYTSAGFKFETRLTFERSAMCNTSKKWEPQSNNFKIGYENIQHEIKSQSDLDKDDWQNWAYQYDELTWTEYQLWRSSGYPLFDMWKYPHMSKLRIAHCCAQDKSKTEWDTSRRFSSLL